MNFFFKSFLFLVCSANFCNGLEITGLSKSSSNIISPEKIELKKKRRMTHVLGPMNMSRERFADDNSYSIYLHQLELVQHAAKGLIDELADVEADKENLFSAVGRIENEMIEKENEIKRMKPMLTIRKKIETYECLIAPELNDPKSVFNHFIIKSTNQLMNFHEAKWTIILQKNVSIVNDLNDLIAKSNILPSTFCRTMGSFFMLASGGIHVPPLRDYSKSQMVEILRTDFQIHDNTTIRCVTDVLMAV